VKCIICERGCHISEASTGACGMYRNVGNAVRELYPDHYLLVCPISVETMPMLHFHPAAKFLQISTVGCNFDCPGCISTLIVKEFDPARKVIRRMSPEAIVQEAEKQGCEGIAFLMNDPLAAFRTFVNVGTKAKERGLMVGCASNAYFTEDSLSQLLPILDFIHVGFKGYLDASYIECGARNVAPVLRNLQILYNRGIHTEVSCVHKRGRDHELEALARHVSRISQDIPFHVMRFVPLEETPSNMEPSIRASERLCDMLKTFLNHVYLFNSPGTKFLSTFCPSCKDLIFRREFYGPMGAKLKMNGPISHEPHKCPSCHTPLSIRGKIAPFSFDEKMFEGGYPFTRALEILESILIAIGVTRKSEIAHAWDQILTSRVFPQLHKEIQVPESFLALIAELGNILGRFKEAERLITFLRGKLNLIGLKVQIARKRPRVYYAMGKPWFCINGNRMENNLVELAGGESLNRLVPGKGRPGTEIGPEVLNGLNPEVIFISAMFGSPLEDFYSECLNAGIDVDATRNSDVYCHPIPVSDFGSPRWILGLMHIANVLHPKLFRFDIEAEAKAFYRDFYHVEYNPRELNLSFAKPLRTWSLT
jgi:pyruvate formate lyase activating enzyme